MEPRSNLSNLGEVDVVYKSQSSRKDRPQIQKSTDAVDVFKLLFHKEKLGLQEQFAVLYLDRNNRVIGCAQLFNGGVSATVVDIRIILAAALKLLATGVLIAHNHPSGNLKPSSEDVKITKKLKGALELMDIVLLDHIILCPEHHYLSMSEEGILP